MQAQRDNSVAFSLRELRELEQRRISDEQTNRRELEEAAVRAAAEAVEHKARTEAAQIQAEREERYRIEAARAEASRNERLQLEAHELAERMRHQAMLDAERMREELDIKRIEANKKRPKWMLAVTALATVATGVLVWFTIQAMNQSDMSAAATRVAEARSAEAVQARKDSDAELTRLTEKLAVLDGKVTVAVANIGKAQGAADLKKAKAEFDALRTQQIDAANAAAAAKAKHDAWIRNQGVKLNKACLDNPLSKECMK